MARHVTFGALCGLALIGLAAAAPAVAQDTKFVTIGTAGQTGICYVVGQSVCKFFNRHSSEHGYRYTAPATGGPIANLNGIVAGDLDLATVQSDWQYHVMNGASTFSNSGPNEKLRSVFSAHPDVVTVVARADLKGKKVNISNPGLGSRATAEVLLDTIGIKVEDLALTSALKSAEQSQALCDNKIDASVEKTPHYAKATIPAGMYQGQSRPFSPTVLWPIW